MRAELRNQSGRRVLVVDDDPNAASLLKLVLSDAGFVVDCADSSESAIAAAAHSPPAILITDYLLSNGSSAIDIVRAVRDQDPGAPIIFVTGAAEEDVLAAVDNLGNCIVLQKPIDIEHLLSVVLG